MNKNRRTKNKDSSIASTNTGATTNINFPNHVANKFVRPFSGDENKQTKGKVFEVDKKKLLVRPKTAQIFEETKSNNENRFSVITPTNFEIDKHDEWSNNMPLIEEKSSNKSTTDCKVSNNRSECQEQREKQFCESPKVGVINEARKKQDSSSASKKLNKSGSSQKDMHLASVADQNDYEISIKNPWILANEHSRRSSKLLDAHKSRKDLIPDWGSDIATHLNLGSPQQNKIDDSHNIIIARVSGKRPNSAGNRAFNPDQKHEELYPNLLSSTVGISRKGVKMNLANMMFSMPEVESSNAHYDSRASITKSIKQSSNYNSKSKAITLIQKHLRGYLARFKIAKEKELYEFLKHKTNIDDEHTENIGEPLKLSDLSIAKPIDSKGKLGFKDPKMRNRKYNEVIYDFSVSKIEQTIEIDQTVRNYTIDDRDIDNKDMNLIIHESPLPKNMHEDEVSIISSRIETNRKFNQNMTIDGLSSNRINTQNNESLRILESLKRKPQTNMIYIESKSKKLPKDYEWSNLINEHDEMESIQPSFSKYTQNSKGLPPPDWRKSLTHIKKTQSDKKSSIKGKSKESIDAILSTHRQKAQKDLIQENALKKKRPWSAETNQNKVKQLDIAKIQASLRLLKKSINKSVKSVASSKEALENSENYADSNKIQITQNTVSEMNLFKRQSEKSKLFKRNSKRAASEFSSSNQAKILKDIVYTPKELTGRGKQSPHVPKLRRMFGSEKIVKQHSKRNYNEILTDSAITDNIENKAGHDTIEAYDVEEKSIFDRSTFEDFSYK